MSKTYITKRDLEEMYRLIDEEVDKQEVICTKGCAYCCSQFVPLHDFEIVHIETAIKNLNNKVKEKMRVNYQKNLDHWLSYFNNKRSFNFENDLAWYIWKHAHSYLECPLLLDNQCVIYQARPIACRLHAAKDDLDKCKKYPLRDNILALDDFHIRIVQWAMQSGPHYMKPLLYSIAKVIDKKRKLPQVIKDTNQF